MEFGQATQVVAFNNDALSRLTDEINQFLLDCADDEMEVIKVKIFPDQDGYTGYVVFKDIYGVSKKGDAEV